MGRGESGVRSASDTTIEIDFYYLGARCKERLKLPPTKANLLYAQRLRGAILNEIALGTFDYAKHFPRSRRARSLAKQPARLELVGDLLDAWLERKRAELEHSTAIEYRRAVGVLKASLGELRIGELTRVAIRDFVAGKAGVSAKYLNNTLLPLRQMLAEAVDDRLLTENPILGFKVRRKGGARPRVPIDPFAPAEVEAILAACDDPFRNLVQFGFWSGLRPSELIALRWGDVSLPAGTVTVQRAFVRGQDKSTKTLAGQREVTLMPQALAALKAQRQHSQLAGGHVFPNWVTGKPFPSFKAVRIHHWARALRLAGVRLRAPKQMRHTYASMLVSSGENLMWVAKQLGHNDWTVTAKRYARWLPSMAPDAGGKVVAAYAAAVEKNGPKS